MTKPFVSLEDVLGKDSEALDQAALGEFETTRLGVVPFSSIDHDEFKRAKKDATIKNPDGSRETDEDKVMLNVIVTAVDKDKRSNFTFADKRLLEKLGVVTATAAVTKLLNPGEIYNFAVAIQEASGFGEKAQKEREEAVKNS